VLKQFILIVALLISAARADALEYTDVYYNPAEDGWGMFLVQSDTTQFLALFIYGADNKPTWYTGVLEQDAAGNSSGPLYATTGTHFALPWNPSQFSYGTAGTVSFQPTDPYHARVSYTLTAGPTITKTVQRQTLTPYRLAGNYSGSASGTQSGCVDPGNNDTHLRATYDLAVTQNGDVGATLKFSFVDVQNNGIVCTAQGPMTHLGRLHKLPAANFSCVGPGAIPGTNTVVIDSLHPTDQGIEGRLTGPIGAGCVLNLSFAAVLNN
jgi:hypothetical protein